MPKLSIRQWPLSLETGRQTILETALAKGVPYPHGCRIGECAACKSLLLSGEVKMANYDQTVLSKEERASGLILACRARPTTDVHVAWLGDEEIPGLPVSRVKAEVTNIEHLTPRIRRIHVWPERPLQFAAGQLARLKFGKLPARPYSMANRPDEEALVFDIRLVPDGQVSEHIRTELQVGERLHLEGPFGSTHLRPEETGPLVAVAGGSGLAPIKSILRTALRSSNDRKVDLFFGVRDEEDVYDETTLNLLAARHPNVRFEILLSAPSVKTGRRVGTLPDILINELPTYEDARYYLAGPPAMVEAVSTLAIKKGVRPDRIHADPFHLASEPRNGDAAPGESGGMLGSIRRLFSKQPEGV